MNCSECQDIIHAYQDDELEEQLLTKTEAHLASCPDCRHEAADLVSFLNRLRAAFPNQMPPAALWEKVRGRTKTR